MTKNSLLRLKKPKPKPTEKPSMVTLVSPECVYFRIQFLCEFLCHLQNAALEKLQDKSECKSSFSLDALIFI